MESISTVFNWLLHLLPGGLVNWLLMPMSGSSVHEIAPNVSWHARLMVVAWSVLIPVGIIIARFYKVTPKQNFPTVKDNHFWWNVHRLCQYSGAVLMLIALYQVASFKPFTWHKTLGYIVIVIGILQIISAFLRGTKGGPTDVQMQGDHYDMTKRRLIFEAYHKKFGYASLLLVVITTILGLYAADAPHWMWLVIGLWWLLLCLIFIVLQSQGRHIDTYAAIWGKPFL